MQSDKLVASKKFTINNKFGLHVRPATAIAEIALRYSNTDVTITGSKSVNAKDPLMVLTLSAPQGSEYTVSASGPDAEDAVDSIIKLAERKFDVKND